MQNHSLITDLPTQNGISPSKVYLPNLNQLPFVPMTVLDYFCAKFANIECGIWQARFVQKLIFVLINGQCVYLTGDEYYHQFQNHTIYYYRQVKKETVVPFDYELIFENERLLVVDKPHFLTISPAGNYVEQTLLTRLKRDYHNLDITPIHRLDKDTSGVVLFCKDKRYRGAYHSLFATKSVIKTYHAIAPYKPMLIFPMTLSLNLQRGEPFYTMQVVDIQNTGKTPNTQTHIELLVIKDGFAKYKLTPITGKLHQLRVHLNHLGIAIKNDCFYPKVRHKKDDDFSNPLQLLAKRIQFIDPIDNQSCDFYSKKELYL